jgi:catechol 2,3-dioxygenase-like lactoylglutathione lyase family enzyme
MSLMPNLYTVDVERSVAFYRDLLGVTETFRHPGEGRWSTLNCDSATSRDNAHRSLKMEAWSAGFVSGRS